MPFTIWVERTPKPQFFNFEEFIVLMNKSKMTKVGIDIFKQDYYS